MYDLRKDTENVRQEVKTGFAKVKVEWSQRLIN